jgi:5-hydroxyisourate hydrolase-like protein (transthyretin family)
MRTHWSRLFSWLLVSVSVALPIIGQDSQWNVTVTGRVVDAQGKPVAGAKIEVFPLEVGISGPLPSAITDKNGEYRFVSPAFGKTRLCAVKEEAGYPNTQGLLFVSGKDSRPVVNLTSTTKLEDVNIVLGEPDGIAGGTIMDATTGTPISNARVTLRRLDGVSAIYSTSLPKNGQFLFALPPVPISMTVTAPGYEVWQYKDPHTFASGLVLKNSEHQTMNVELKATK